MKKIKLLAFVALVGLLSACGEEAKPTPKSIDILLDGKIVKTINAEIGDRYSLTAKVNPFEASQEVSWKISDPKIGTISEAGVLDIEKEGEAVITASSLINPNITTNLYLFVAEPVQQTGVGNGFTAETPIFEGNEGKDEPLEIYFIEVRQMYADAIYIRKGNVDILIDSGEAFDGTYVNKILKDKMHDNRLDLLIASHSDSDHIAGMENALKDIELVSTIIDYGGAQGGSFARIRQSYIEKGANYHTAYDCVNYNNGITDKYYLTDEFTLDILDTGNYLQNSDTSSASNGHSVACLFTYKDFKFFTAGDLTTSSEADLLKREDLPNVTLYKASHHGSNGSNSQELLNTLNPKGVAISAARYSTSYGIAPSEKPTKNDTNLDLAKGHPYNEALERIYKTPNIMTTLDVHWNAVNGTMCYTTYGEDSYTFQGSTPLKGYYDLSKTGGSGKWNDELQDWENRVTGEENKKFHETVAFKARGYEYMVEGLIQ